MDHVIVHCECGETLRVKTQHAGRSGQCKGCRRDVVIPAQDVIERNLGRQVSLGDLSTLADSPTVDSRNENLEDVPVILGGLPLKSAEAVPDNAVDDNVPARPELRSSESGRLWQPGQLVDGRYQVEKKLGQGGCGIVWKARHTEWSIDLAVKEFIDAAKLKPETRERRRTNFVRESQAWVDEIGMHPHVVTAWYVRELHDTPYLFLEYCDGGDLGDWIDQGKTRDLQTALDIAIQLAWGLAHCHEKGIVHRDFKPQNVMMTADGTAKITDFGMVKFAAIESDEEGAEAETAAGDVRQTLAGRGPIGTPPYMPPEQWGTGQIDHRADLYALGVTIHELLSGEYPIALPSRRQFPAGGAGYRAWLNACAEAHREDQPASLHDKRDDVPAELEQLVQACLAKQANDRPSDVTAIVQSILQIYEASTSKPYGRPSPSEIQPMADGLNNQGVSLSDLGNQKEASLRFEAAIDSDPHHPEANFNQGLLRWRKGEMSDVELVLQLQEICTSHRDQWIDEFLLAQVHLERGDHESALKLLESIEKHSGNALEIGRVLTELRGVDLAEQCGRCLRTYESAIDVSSVSFSADGNRALSAGRDKALKLWDVNTGECLQTFKSGLGHVMSTSISEDGRYALSAGEERTLKLWDVQSGEYLRTFQGHSDAVNSVSLSADGRYALSGSDDNTLKLWNVNSGECERTFEGHASRVPSVSFSADGRYALSGSWDCTVKLWDFNSGECLRTFRGHKDWVSSVSFSADGRYALSGSGDNTLKLWDVTTGECLRTFEGHMFGITSVSLSADGRYAMSGSSKGDYHSGYDETLKLWDVESGECLRIFRGHADTVNSVSFSADGRYALSGGKGSPLKLWQIGRPDIRKAKLRLTRIFDSQSLLQSQSDVESRLRQAERAVNVGEFGHAAVHIHHARSSASSARRPKLLKLWTDLYTHLPRTAFRGGWHLRTFEGHRNGVRSVSFSADGRHALSSGSYGQTLKLWDVITGECRKTIETRSYDWKCYSLSGLYALSVGSRDRNLELWDVESGEQVRTFEGHTSRINSVSLSADGRYALSGSIDETTKLWDVGNGECLQTMEGLTLSFNSISFSADGRCVLSGSAGSYRSGSDATLNLWNVKTGECLRTFKGHTDQISSVALSADGRSALSAGSWNNTLKLWDVKSGECLQTFQGHTDPVSSVSFSADCRYALSGSRDKTLRIWDVESGECLRTFEGHTKEVNSVSFSADGRYALSGSNDETVRLWFLDWELDNRDSADWDEAARPWLQNFLTMHTPPKKLFRRSQPTWSDSDFKQLTIQLGYAGFGWLRPEGVKSKLLEMAADWTGPPPLGGE